MKSKVSSFIQFQGKDVIKLNSTLGVFTKLFAPSCHCMIATTFIELGVIEWNLIIEHFSKLCGEKSSSFEIREIFRLFNKRHNCSYHNISSILRNVRNVSSKLYNKNLVDSLKWWVDLVSSITFDWFLAPRRRGFYHKSKSTNYPEHGHHGNPSPTRKMPMVEPGIEPATLWLVVRSSDHQTTRLVKSQMKI